MRRACTVTTIEDNVKGAGSRISLRDSGMTIKNKTLMSWRRSRENPVVIPAKAGTQ
jgi:hypothetical protein